MVTDVVIIVAIVVHVGQVAIVGQHTEGGCSRQDRDSSNCRTRTSTTLYGQSKRANAHEDEAAQWRRQGM
jgi:hypothetical protein